MLRSKIGIVFVVGGSAGAAPALHGQESADTLADALREGSLELAFRYRYEFVDQAGIDAEANASLLRTRLTYQTAPYRNLSFLAEVDDLRNIGPDDYNSTRNGKTARPLVADPEGTDLNQAHMRYTGFADTTIRFGRQRINHANQRFIGAVGWRQNEQTYDALEVEHALSESSRVRYTYIDNVNRVFGPDDGNPPGDLRSSSHLVDGSIELTGSMSIGAYGYFLDLDEAPSASNRTLGVRFSGVGMAGPDVSVPYTLEFATQSDHADNPADFDANYYLVEAGLSWPNLSVKLSRELLEGNGRADHAFSTPLATLHPFQGWADRFLSTPDDGLEDTYLTVIGSVGPVELTVMYHDFSADRGGASYGDELDVSAEWSFADNFSLTLKLASYRADSYATDTDKLWVMLSAAF